MRRNKNDLILALLLIAALLIPPGVAAEGPEVELDRLGSITLDLQRERESGESRASFCLYQVGEVIRTAEGFEYVLTADFAASGASLADLRAEGLAGALATYAEGSALAGDVEQADVQGKVRFANVSVGLYLLVQEGEMIGWYPVMPFLVSVPLADATGGGWLYDVNASPKMERRPPEVTAVPSASPEPVASPRPTPTPVISGGDDSDDHTPSPKPTPPAASAPDAPAAPVVSVEPGDTPTPPPAEPTASPLVPAPPHGPTGDDGGEDGDDGDDPNLKPAESASPVPGASAGPVVSAGPGDTLASPPAEPSASPPAPSGSVQPVPVPPAAEEAPAVTAPPEAVINPISPEAVTDSGPPDSSVSADHLLRTGQLNWPIPLLAVTGLLLFALGWALVFGKKGGGGDEE